ncbi:prolyl aminopeptidase [Sporanaerobacter acetigenes]|uniref:prolyl aminopeptidase n=1 Tax=Sporanaerobacter acetigenes TaxID=165813 RepID=UPI0010519321|nr:prolyl aminopeptidase [Sporanaerobacter acetigenes]
MKNRFNLFPKIEPYEKGYLKVSDLHTIYYEEVGNPKGKPILFLHGGPGAGLDPMNRCYFDPDFYRIILFDQRGCGKSEPHAELKENTTWDLVEDIEKLREHCNIDKWVVFGGSWGATLSLIYAICHPENVLGLILRGIWLSRKSEVYWLYQEGASRFYPEVWEEYLKPIPKEKRGDIVKAYYEIFNNGSEEEQIKAARSWSIWEGSISKLIPSEDLINSFGDPFNAISIAKIECHYFVNNMFAKSDNYILENIDQILHIPTVIVNGRYDLVCPIYTAWELHKALPKSKFIVVKDAGHSATEVGIISELVQATEEYKKLY